MLSHGADLVSKIDQNIFVFLLYSRPRETRLFQNKRSYLPAMQTFTFATLEYSVILQRFTEEPQEMEVRYANIGFYQ